MPKSRTPLIILSIVLSGFLLWVLWSKIQPGDFVRMMTSIYLPALFVYMAVNMGMTILRAWRYKWLLHPVQITWGDILIVTLIRNSFDDLLPARIGSLSYIYVLTDRLDKPFENTASSFVISLIFDFLTLAPFLVLAVLSVGLGAAGIPTWSFLVLAVVFFCLFLAIVRQIVPLARIFRNLAAWLIGKTKWKDSPRAVQTIRKLDQTIEILRQTKDRGIYLQVFGVSLLIRLGKYLSLFALLFAVLRSQGIAFGDLSFWKTILGLTGAEMTSALPIKGLAGFGTWESAWAAALQLMRFDPRLAILSGLGVHLITNLFEYALGLSGIALLAFRRKRDRISRIP